MSRKVKIDLTGVESFQKASEGQHVARIAAAEESTSQGGNDMIKVTFVVTKGADKDSRVIENYPLTETALWKLKGMLQAIGMKCEGKIMLDLDRLIGKTCIIEVVHEEYNGNTRAKVSECRRLIATSDEEDIDEEDIDEEEEEAPKKKSKKKEKKNTKKKEKAPEEDENGAEDDEDWDEEEEEKPKKKAKKSAKSSKATKKEEPEEDEDDDDDWDDDEDWDEE